MAEQKIYKNDVGLIIELNMNEDISSATSLSYKVTKPDLTTTTWTPTIYGTNYLRYTTVAGDLSQAGEYKLQPCFTLGSWVGCGNTVTFRVYDDYQ